MSKATGVSGEAARDAARRELRLSRTQATPASAERLSDLNVSYRAAVNGVPVK